MDTLNFIQQDSHPTRSDALKNRQLILQAARRLFAEHGVEAVPMCDIAEAAGVGKGTLYRHFENKIALCQALLDDDQRALQERTLERLRAGHEPLDNLRWFSGQVIEFVMNYTSLLYSGEAEGQFSTLEHPAHVWWRQTIRGLLLQSGAVGDLDYMADTLYLMLDARTIRFQQRAWNYDVARITGGVEALIEQFGR